MGMLYYITARRYEGLHEVKDNGQLRALFAKNAKPIDPAKVSWCAAFVEAILIKHGVKATGELTARSYLKWGSPIDLKDIQTGDIVVFKRGIRSWQGHVGFFAGLSANGNVLILGGNQGNKVCKKYYPIKKILGVRR